MEGRQTRTPGDLRKLRDLLMTKAHLAGYTAVDIEEVFSGRLAIAERHVYRRLSSLKRFAEARDAG